MQFELTVSFFVHVAIAKPLLFLSLVLTEPLYQVYTRCTLQRQRSISRQRIGSDSSDKSLTDDEAFLEQLEKGTLRNMRVLWCELPEVC